MPRAVRDAVGDSGFVGRRLTGDEMFDGGLVQEAIQLADGSTFRACRSLPRLIWDTGQPRVDDARPDVPRRVRRLSGRWVSNVVSAPLTAVKRFDDPLLPVS
jgi:hypothetical protein